MTRKKEKAFLEFLTNIAKEFGYTIKKSDPLPYRSENYVLYTVKKQRGI